MVAPGVPLPANAIKEVRMPANVVPNAKECGLLAVLLEQVQNKRGPLRMGAVIKSQVHGRAAPPPKEVRKKRGDRPGDARAVHAAKFGRNTHIMW